ncbi:uncharacterized protein PITG_11956 [Phytophthora infestans T30-4]|uniref:Uncharacterized protein n=1 Tax=Phytophthora infestans (strain T30-4) TaxID=403677 RepID=D0NHL8_PHYIT|nr:uncharacterized protein PITG_11956 [Phytophthora infestans T30-4]EEY58943.1 conserved hypothetical protein [Phytophthora infestans T30-4]|eukprot:XP_002901416.1 conserved hypothetical protein [Phytophthora infestans T30-4]
MVDECVLTFVITMVCIIWSIMLAPFKCLLVSALAVSVVNGHGYLTIPKVRFTAQAGDPTQYIASIQASDSGFSGTFNGAPKDNVAAFTKAFKASKYTSLKEFFTDKAKIGVPVLPFDREACMGATTLTFYWMAMHSESWQVYVNCAPLEKTTSTGAKSKYAVGSSTSTAQSNSTSSATSDTPSTPATEAPSAPSTPSETTAPAPPSPTDAPSTPSTDAPSTPSTDAPSTPSTDAPSTPSTDAPSTPSTPTAPTTDKSDCGSYDVAGSDSDCGSYDVAGGDDSECGSYDVAGGAESDCGSFDVAGSGGGDATKGAGSQTSFDFSAMQQGEVNTGTVSPYK